MANIAFYGSHNAAIVVEQEGKILLNLEVERYLGQKNAGYTQYLPCYSRTFLLDNILEYIKDKFGITKFDTCLYQNTDVIDNGTKVHYDRLIPADNYVNCFHHRSHAAGAFYQSDLDKAIILSFDGGGNDGFFNIFIAENRKDIKVLSKTNLDLGFAYMIFGQYLGDIKLEPALNIGNLVYSGKIMGLCSYGNVNEDWLPHFKAFYKSKPDGVNYLPLIEELGNKIKVSFNVKDRIKGQVGYDIAATSQRAFEDLALEELKKYTPQYKDYPIVITGGCGLNILFNTRLKQEYNVDIFVPPNPNDCGLASGMMLDFLKPDKAIDLTYSGLEILDKDRLMHYAEERRGRKITDDTVLNHLVKGAIIGVVRGKSEHGPRALGNRSILCNPGIEGMKDTLNKKVKDREWYRPFAPVCRQEDVETYFNFKGESRWMSFCPTVKEEWRDKLSAITHTDNTARVQTVTKEQNPWLYDLLTKFKEKTGYGVLLNTSFNVNKKPILNSIEEAFQVYDKTELDSLLIEDMYFTKLRK